MCTGGQRNWPAREVMTFVVMSNSDADLFFAEVKEKKCHATKPVRGSHGHSSSYTHINRICGLCGKKLFRMSVCV